MDGMLSSLYTAWIDQLLAGPIPAETKATCENCAMLPQGEPLAGGVYFHPTTRCCTFQPALANYRAGLILADDDTGLAAGRHTVESRLAARIAVTPLGMNPSARFLLLYENASGAFGRGPELGCPHQIEGQCGIWAHRPATCTTWFCKHVRGATGFEFWKDLGRLLNEVDSQLGLWCAVEMGIEVEQLARLLESRPMDATDLGAAIPDSVYRRFWGSWVGREAEFYRACAELVRPLAWDEITRICGPRLGILSRMVLDRYRKVTSEEPLESPRVGLIQIERIVGGKYSAVTYSPYDRLKISAELAAVLPHFDGRPVGTVVEEIRTQRGIRIDPALVRRMADFRVLVEGGSE
jgi:hypothetical protein